MVELQSVGMNVAGVGWIVALARKMNHLEVLIGTLDYGDHHFPAGNG